ncbi:MAG: NAD(P)/FAD-dependent oxidoreductase [Myxococcaceae bacterium]
MARQRVVIIGGGFGGLYVARALQHPAVDVTLIDRSNHHLFQPLLYQVATAALSPGDIAAPIRALLAQPNARVFMAEVQGFDLASRQVRLTDGEKVPYDYLVVAAGAQDAYFGNAHWAKFAPGLKSLEDALELRRRIFTAYENAEREKDDTARRAWMTFVIIGAGPTGVELAGALAEIARHVLVKDFRHIDSAQTRIVLVEGMARVLPSFSEPLSAAAQAFLQRLGVEMKTGVRVTDIDAEGVQLGPERLAAKTVVWAAGVRGSPLGALLGAPLDRAGRVLVTPFLTLPHDERVFVIGDMAAVQGEAGFVPGVAPAAIQQGKHAAKNILHLVQGEPLVPFKYRDRGTFAVIGRGAAVGVAFGRAFRGGLAWFAWLGIHLLFLIGFRNRLAVLLNWAYSYVTFRRSSRLIYRLPQGPDPKPPPTTTA